MTTRRLAPANLMSKQEICQTCKTFTYTAAGKGTCSQYSKELFPRLHYRGDWEHCRLWGEGDLKMQQMIDRKGEAPEEPPLSSVGNRYCVDCGGITKMYCLKGSLCLVCYTRYKAIVYRYQNMVCMEDLTYSEENVLIDLASKNKAFGRCLHCNLKKVVDKDNHKCVYCNSSRKPLTRKNSHQGFNPNIKE